LDLVHARSLPQAEGRSLRPALLGEPMPEVPVFSMAMQRQSRFHPIRSGHYVVIEGTQKLVYHLASDRHELYDLATDPHEQRDLANERPDQAAKLRELVRKRIAVAEAQRQRGFVNEEQQEPIAP
jgi:arylsulfatase A-like enzyme